MVYWGGSVHHRHPVYSGYTILEYGVEREPLLLLMAEPLLRIGSIGSIVRRRWRYCMMALERKKADHLDRLKKTANS